MYTIIIIINIFAVTYFYYDAKRRVTLKINDVFNNFFIF